MTVEGNSFVWREYREEGIEKGQKVREWHWLHLMQGTDMKRKYSRDPKRTPGEQTACVEVKTWIPEEKPSDSRDQG